MAPVLPPPSEDSTGEEIVYTGVLQWTNSRSTTVFRGRRLGEDVAVKLSLASKWEGDVLQALAGCETVPRLVSTVQDGSRTYVSLFVLPPVVSFLPASVS